MDPRPTAGPAAAITMGSRYLAGRICWGAVTLLVVATLTFLLTFVIPADPARAIAGLRASAEDVARIRDALGLNEPVLHQLAGYLARAAQGDLGYSYHHREPVLELIVSRFPATVQLAIAGLAVAVLVGVPLGVLAAQRSGQLPDRAAMLLSAVLVSIPSFWLGYLLIDLLAFRPLVAFDLDLFPIGGYRAWDLRYLALPAIVIGAGSAAYYARLTRNLLLDELRQDYVRTARAKGMIERLVTWRHAFRNVSGPLLTHVGLDFGFFLGGVVIVEQVFSWPGIGRLAIDAVANADIPLIMGTVMFGTFCIVVANLVVDGLVVATDPRIRLATRGR